MWVFIGNISWVFKHLRNKEPSVVIGFNKMPGLDVYFAADPCFLEKAENQRGPLYSLPLATVFR